MTRAKELLACLIEEIESLNRFLKEEDRVKIVKVKEENQGLVKRKE
jgi:hypothetical protein